MIELFIQKKNCCNCAACKNICPNKAITTEPDEDGYVFPKINRELCTECGLCNEVCDFQKTSINGNVPLFTYAAINKDRGILINSASGGVFGALASFIFDKNGVVFGCAYDDKMNPKHICIDSLSDLKKIQGSKYVQSDINNTYTQVKTYLKNGKWVLFTGTPCQIAALKSYLKKDYSRLLTADLICHGVPNADFFKGYIRHLEDKLKGKVIDFKFRDKSKGWGLRGKVVYKKHGNVFCKTIFPIDSYYYNYFLGGYTYRESCYECKYACGIRVGDFTIGDYWGVEKFHPEIERRGGVSVLLVNSQKGAMLTDELTKYLDLTESAFEQARMQNEQLNKPIAKSTKREMILKTWREGGYKAVAEEYYKAYKRQIILSRCKRLIPKPVKKSLKKILRVN